MSKWEEEDMEEQIRVTGREDTVGGGWRNERSTKV